MRRTLLLLPLLTACAAAPATARCPASPPTAATAATPTVAVGRPVTELLARLPDGADVLARVDVRRIMETRMGRMLAPLGVWSTAYARTRGPCTERPWEQLVAVEAVYREEGMAAALLGPIADEGNSCAPAALQTRSVDEFRARETAGGASLVLGAEPLRAALAAARGGDDSAREDEAFAALPPGMADPLLVVLVRGRAYRQAMTALNQAADEMGHDQAPGQPPLPRLELASEALLQSLRGVRIEVGLLASGELDLRLAMLFPTADDARRYTDASAGDMRTRVPAYAAELILREMRDNPDAPRAAQGFTTELSAWLTEVSPLQQRGPVVEVTFGAGGASSVMVSGVLAAVAIPAFTRYVKRSKTAEAVANVRTIAGALESELNAMPPARRRTARLAALPAMPPGAPSASKYPADESRWTASPWRRVGFSIAAAHYYQYRVDVDGRCYVAVAEGDLDGDGARSSFSQRVCPGADGTYTVGELQIQNELE
jgi:hypothetical protein